MLTRCECCRKYSNIEANENPETFSHICEIENEKKPVMTRNPGQVKFEDCDESPLLTISQKPHIPCPTPAQDDLENFSHKLAEESKLEEVVVSTTY